MANNKMFQKPSQKEENKEGINKGINMNKSMNANFSKFQSPNLINNFQKNDYIQKDSQSGNLSSKNELFQNYFEIKESRLKGIFECQTRYGRKIYTINFNPGKKVYDENIIVQKGIEYREWNPRKSKLGAAIMKGISQIGIMPGKSVLYLGCSTGTTCSHISDIIGKDGFLFGVDFAPRVMREFVFLCEERSNMSPIMADCNKPEKYEKMVPKVDVVFQDIAQRNQVEIFIKNCNKFLKDNGTGILAVKARSIDVTKNPKAIFNDVRQELGKAMTIVDYRELEPYEKDHCIFVVKKKQSTS